MSMFFLANAKIVSHQTDPLTLWYMLIAIAGGIFALIPQVRKAFEKAWAKIVIFLVASALKDRDNLAEETHSMVYELKTALLGRKATDLIPNPEPGIIDRLENVELSVEQAIELANTNNKVMNEIAKEIQKQAPNGGDTNNTGDLILRMARQMGEELDAPAEQHDHNIK